MEWCLIFYYKKMVYYGCDVTRLGYINFCIGWYDFDQGINRILLGYFVFLCLDQILDYRHCLDRTENFQIIHTLFRLSGQIFQINRTLLGSSGNFQDYPDTLLDHPDSFQIIQIHFLDYPDTFQIVRKLSSSSGHFAYYLDILYCKVSGNSSANNELVAKTFRICKYFPVMIADALTGFLRLWSSFRSIVFIYLRILVAKRTFGKRDV